VRPARGDELLRAVAELPGGRQLLALSEDRDHARPALVGGAVRDLLLERTPRELDVVLDGDVAALARELADELGAGLTVHERFGTALVEWEEGRVDLARRRAESYPAPGALPEVRAGSAEEDLARRDFTVNALALALTGANRGELVGVEHAFADLGAGRLRVLHERSFIDDPTRLLRLARYHARLRFQLEPHTAELVVRARDADALATVSRSRIGAELRLAAREADAPAALAAMDELGLLSALHVGLRFDGELARDALELLAGADTHAAGDARADLLVLAALLRSIAAASGATATAELSALLDDLEIVACDRDVLVEAAVRADALARELARASSSSQIYEAASRASLQAVALAGALGRRAGSDASRAGERWLGGLHRVRLSINGDDLLAAGVPQGPEIGARLHAALMRKLDDGLDGKGREAELRAAVEARV
jgi:tRNA nucleotidyltransferase (CCA-adding enzyme)